MLYLTVKDASARLKVHENTILRWLTNGTIKGVKFGKLWRIPDTEIERVAKP
jgi:acetyl-CoA synthetase